MKYIRIILVIILVCSLGMVAKSRIESKRNEEASNIAKELSGMNNAEDIVEETVTVREKNIYKDDTFAAEMESVDLKALREVSENVLGWIAIPGTKVDYPLMKGLDNEYYLNHSWDGKRNSSGAIFLERLNNEDLSDFHTLIYGHRIIDGIMFGSLKYYDNIDYWENNRYVYVNSDSYVYKYEIFASYEASVKSYTYQIGFKDDESKQTFIDFCLDQSVIDTGVVPSVDDNILTLSTCTGMGSYSRRWVVQAVLVE